VALVQGSAVGGAFFMAGNNAPSITSALLHDWPRTCLLRQGFCLDGDPLWISPCPAVMPLVAVATMLGSAISCCGRSLFELASHRSRRSRSACNQDELSTWWCWSLSPSSPSPRLTSRTGA